MLEQKLGGWLEMDDDKGNWKAEGSFDDVAGRYLNIDGSVNPDVLTRRKSLFDSLNGKLLVPEQQPLLDYASQNAQDVLIFEGGGTFGFFANSFLDIIYADALASELKNRGKKAVNFFIIDPTDISRFERMLSFAGRKVKMPLPTNKVDTGKSTETMHAPNPQDIKLFLDTIERELDLYIHDVSRVNHGFQREKEQGARFAQDSAALRTNFARFKQNVFDYAGASKSYREFTDKLLIELISPLVRNSIFVTLNQWQSAWNTSKQFRDNAIYEDIDRISAQVGEKEGVKFPALRREDGRYFFPFRIDTKEWMWNSPVVDIQEGRVYMDETQIKETDILPVPLENLFSDKFNLIPHGGLLYALDSIAYDAIPLVPPEPRVIVGYLLAKEKGNPKPFLTQYAVPFYSVGRITKGAPEIKTSGSVAAYLEGLNHEFVEKAFSQKTGNEFSVKSPIFERYSQPIA